MNEIKYGQCRWCNNSVTVDHDCRNNSLAKAISSIWSDKTMIQWYKDNMTEEQFTTFSEEIESYIKENIVYGK